MKYFCVSDLHGCFKELQLALTAHKFDPSNPNHTLIVIGDLFDRGDQSFEIYSFIQSLERKIILKGNHEDILLEAIKRGEMSPVDIYNGLGATLYSLDKGFYPHRYTPSIDNYKPSHQYLSFEDFDAILQRLQNNFPFIEFLSTLPYYAEFNKYILTHGWVPEQYYTDTPLEQCSKQDWQHSIWPNTETKITQHITRKKQLKKTLVVGHWHTFRLREAFEYKNYTSEDLSQIDPHTIWTNPQFKIIALDGCVNHSKLVNVFTFIEK